MNNPLTLEIGIGILWLTAMIAGSKRMGFLANAAIVFMFLFGLRLAYLLLLS